jgi:hypothetical protein
MKSFAAQGNEALQNENKKLREENDHLQIEIFQKQKFEELTKNFMKTNEELKNSKREIQDRLTEALSNINKLMTEVEEYKAEEALKVDIKPATNSNLHKGSVLDEVANQIALDLNKPIKSMEESVRKEDERILENLQVTEDYFYLCIKAIETSVLVELSERGIKMPRRSFGLKTLYDKAINDNIPFHEWHSWIRTQFTRDIISEQYRTNEPSGYFAGFSQKVAKWRRVIGKDKETKETKEHKDT